MTTSDPTPVAGRVTPRWQDPTLPTADRVELLLEATRQESDVGAPDRHEWAVHGDLLVARLLGDLPSTREFRAAVAAV